MTNDPTDHVSDLSRRELEIALAYADGASHREIGEHLFIAPSTVRTHLGAIYRKLGVSSKIELLRALGGSSGGALVAPVAGSQETDVSLPTEPQEASGRVGQLSGFFDCPAIAVLPFDNLSGDPQQDFLSSGLTEDIITALSYWRYFPVIARNSTAAAKAEGGTIGEIARQLGARYVVEGSVQCAGDRLRLSAHLVDAESGHNIWTRRFDRQLGDLFEIQDELTLEMATAIEPRVSRAEQSRARWRPHEALDGWELSQRAMWHITQGRQRDYAIAVELLQKAGEIAPGSAYPRSLLAFCRFYQALFGWTSDPAVAFASVAEAARAAVDLDDSDWRAHALFGISRLWVERRHDLARQSLQRALSLNPSASLAHHFNGCVCGFTSDLEEALASQEAVFRIDPDYPFASVVLADMALEYMLMNDLDRAIGYAHRALEVQPGNSRAMQRLLAALGAAGAEDEARAWRERLLALQPDFGMRYIEMTYPFQQDTHRNKFLAGLRAANLGDQLDGGAVSNAHPS